MPDRPTQMSVLSLFQGVPEGNTKLTNNSSVKYQLVEPICPATCTEHTV